MGRMHRRQFLKNALAVSAGAGAAAWWKRPLLANSRLLGSNEDLRVACVGIRGRGNDHIQSFRAIPGVRVVALCDVDQQILAERAKDFTDRGEQVALFSDFRKLLEQKDVDIVTIATPNHWHSLMSVWACQAGKDVYLEKPISHNLWEGRKAVEAATKHRRIVATGTQSRSCEGIRQAIQFVHDGKLGKVKVSRGLCYKPRKSIGRVDADQPVPVHIDYDLWCGPAPKTPLRRKSLHYDWHWVWPTGNGDIGNQGIHQMDIARWALGKRTFSRRVLSLGGRFGYVDDGETPNTQIAVHDFGDALLIFEVRGLETPELRGVKIGNVVECENGCVAMNTQDAWAFDASGNKIQEWKGGGDHYGNFIEAVRARDPMLLRSDVLEGHLSSGLCHLGNISHRMGAAASSVDSIREAFKGNEFAGESLGRFEKHLADNQLDLASVQPTLGMPLEFDAAKEQFRQTTEENKAANEMLTRRYREPFVVPESA